MIHFHCISRQTTHISIVMSFFSRSIEADTDGTKDNLRKGQTKTGHTDSPVPGPNSQVCRDTEHQPESSETPERDDDRNDAKWRPRAANQRAAGAWSTKISA